jgi:predicted metalloprotease with PDZ domain
MASKISGTDLGDFFDSYVRGTHDLPLEQLLGKFGVKLCLRPAKGRRDEGGKPAKPDSKPHPWLGATLVDRNGRAVFGVVHAGSPAEQAGIAAADEAVAIDARRRYGASECISRRRTAQVFDPA